MRIRQFLTPLSAGFLACLPLCVSGAQQTVASSGKAAPGSVNAATLTNASATPATSAPTLDGSDADPAWANATPITAFRTFEPAEDGEPRFRTEARIAYDQGHLYVFVRAFDPHPDSIVAQLSRRDIRTQSDHIKVMVDSYHDRRTAYEFAVNPAGVKRDYYMYDDGVEDISWDAVWEAATRVDSLGWTAEFRIPLSQLRYPKLATNTFGLMIIRDVARTNERYSWPVWRRTIPGVASQFGTLDNLSGLGSSRRLEVVPYAIAKNVSKVTANGFGRSQQQSLGADLKYGLSSNLTLDATVNPDFGQVEADPAVLNLTAFESFFEERRPFFVEGTGIFNFDGGSTQLFYPRRIGRAPQLAGLVEDPSANIPGSSTILAASKITGRLSGGTSVGALAALTQRESAGDLVIEPQTAYGVARLSHDFRKGESGIGVIFTEVNRQLDDATEDFLRRSAQVGGVDVRHRFQIASSRWAAAASFAASRVTGTENAIARTQRSGVHLFNRVDADLDYDPTRTSLTGTYLSGALDKVGGVVRGGFSYRGASPGLETNDIGFLSQADIQSTYAYVSVVAPQPKSFYNRASAQLSMYNQFNAAGMPTGRVPELFVTTVFRNSASFSADLWTDNAGTVLCDRCARGGPALRISPATSLLVNLATDPRIRLQKSFAAIYTTGDGGRSQLWRVRPYLTFRAASNVSMELGARYQRNKDNTQWYDNVSSESGTRYLFAHLDQHLLSFQGRLSVTATPNLSMQFYAEPFVTTGEYDNVREIDAPRAKRYEDRFKPFAFGSAPQGFNEKQFRSNMVVRWEYRPGSSLFVVWSQGRDQGDRHLGNFAPGRDYGDLFSARPDNTLLIKASYWLSL